MTTAIYKDYREEEIAYLRAENELYSDIFDDIGDFTRDFPICPEEEGLSERERLKIIGNILNNKDKEILELDKKYRDLLIFLNRNKDN